MCSKSLTIIPLWLWLIHSQQPIRAACKVQRVNACLFPTSVKGCIASCSIIWCVRWWRSSKERIGRRGMVTWQWQHVRFKRKEKRDLSIRCGLMRSESAGPDRTLAGLLDKGGDPATSLPLFLPFCFSFVPFSTADPKTIISSFQFLQN